MSIYIPSNNNNTVPYVKPDYKNLKNIITPENGLGFSNFRNNDIYHKQNYKVNNNTKLDLIDPMAKYNPNGYSLAEYENERHINKLFTDHYNDTNLICEEEQSPDYVYWDLVKSMEERCPVMDAFFSKRNLDHIQYLIIKMVEFQSDGLYKISRQNDNIILEGMRITYLGSPINGNATGLELKRTIANLNKNILNVVVPYVFSGIQKHLFYIRDQGNMTYTVDRPQNMSEKGTRLKRGFDFNII